MPYNTPDDVKNVFAEEFLKTGSVVRSAKVAGIPERTGRDLAMRLEEDEDFLAARRRLHLHALERGEAAVRRSIEILAQRIEEGPLTIPGDDKRPPVILDKGADNGKAISALFDSLLKRRKIEHDMKPENSESGPVEIVVRVTGDAKPDGTPA